MKLTARISILIALFIVPVCGLMAQMYPVTIVRDSLENGLQIIYSYDNSAPVVACVMHYHTGSKNETELKTGYAHFFEHLMFEATPDIPRATIDKLVLNAGGNLNAYTSYDETVYHFQMPSEHLNLALWIESERMRQLLIDTIGVETQRGVVLEELKMRTTNQPNGSFGMRRQQLLFPGTPYDHSVIGHAEHIQNAKISDFREFYNKYYLPSNATLVICGDFKISEAKKLVRTYFGIYPKSDAPERPIINVKPISTEIREKVEDPMSKVTTLYVSYLAPSLVSEDYYPMSLLLDILASGESSRLYKRIVDKDRLATMVDVSPLFLEDAGAVTFIARPAEGIETDKIEKALLEELAKVAKEGVTDAELIKAKNMNETQIISSRRNVMDKARAIAKFMTYRKNPDLVTSEPDMYLKVTKEQVKSAAEKYLTVTGKVVQIYVPKAKTPESGK